MQIPKMFLELKQLWRLNSYPIKELNNSLNIRIVKSKTLKLDSTQLPQPVLPAEQFSEPDKSIRPYF